MEWDALAFFNARWQGKDRQGEEGVDRRIRIRIENQYPQGSGTVLDLNLNLDHRQPRTWRDLKESIHCIVVGRCCCRDVCCVKGITEKSNNNTANKQQQEKKTTRWAFLRCSTHFVRCSVRVFAALLERPPASSRDEACVF